MNLLKSIPSELLLILIEYLSTKDIVNLYLTNPSYYGRYITPKTVNINSGTSFAEIFSSHIIDLIIKEKIDEVMKRIKNDEDVEFFDQKIFETNNPLLKYLIIENIDGVNKAYLFKQIHRFKIFMKGGKIKLLVCFRTRNLSYSIESIYSNILRYLIENDIELKFVYNVVNVLL
jgi:hypothetical protein